jgi:hypothetical protein
VVRSVAGKVDWKMSIYFTAEGKDRMESTFKRRKEERWALKALQEFGVRLRPSVRVQILGNNQAACSDCTRMREKSTAVKAIHL